MVSQKSIENYITEILFRISKIENKCKNIINLEYISKSPINLINTIQEIGLFIQNVILNYYDSKKIKLNSSSEKEKEKQTDKIIRWLSDTDNFIKELNSYFRYIDGSKTSNLPWSIIPAFEELLESIFPNVEILLRPKWKYNYTIRIEDIKSEFESKLLEYEDYVPKVNIANDVLFHLKKPFYLISFPALEKTNILLHPLLGHEVGHLIADEFLNQKLIDRITIKITPEIEAIVKKELKKDDNLFYQTEFEEKTDQYVNDTINIWKRGLEEIISDIVAISLFGPSVLFANYEISIQYKLDHLPDEYDNNNYPPWRMRLRYLLKYLDKQNEKFFPFLTHIPDEKYEKNIDLLYNEIINICKTRTDEEEIKSDKFTDIAYRNIYSLDDEVYNFLNNYKSLTEQKLIASKLYKNIDKLLIRLENDVPPNAIEYKLNERIIPSIAEIINAAWFFKIAKIDNILNQIYHDESTIRVNTFVKKQNLNRLTLKAIEYSFIDKDYQNFKKRIGK